MVGKWRLYVIIVLKLLEHFQSGFSEIFQSIYGYIVARINRVSRSIESNHLLFMANVVIALINMQQCLPFVIYFMNRLSMRCINALDADKKRTIFNARERFQAPVEVHPHMRSIFEHRKYTFLFAPVVKYWSLIYIIKSPDSHTHMHCICNMHMHEKLW